MKLLILSCLLAWGMFLLTTGYPHPEEELLKGVKSGVKGHKSDVFLGFDKLPNMRNFSGSSSLFKNGSARIDYEKGVCYEEVLTATLVKDPHNVPAGNGSTPAHSKIRTCCPGYTRNIHNFRKCEPVCEHECINAKCIAPNVCSCFPDHVINFDGFCVPTCPIGCFNGHCGADKECVCNSGYTEEPNMKFCIPKCSKGCINGNCTEPEVCTCKQGYKVNEAGECVPHCQNGCDNGDCVAPDECVCKLGYKKSELGKCKPVCVKECINGECIAPNICNCGNGYEMNESGSSCIAFCVNPCLNGDCTGPNECTCRKGFTKSLRDPTGSKCIGNCPNGCPNGICSGPNLCLCLPGYIKDRGVKGSQRCIKRERRSVADKLKIMF